MNRIILFDWLTIKGIRLARIFMSPFLMKVIDTISTIWVFLRWVEPAVWHFSLSDNFLSSKASNVSNVSLFTALDIWEVIRRNKSLSQYEWSAVFIALADLRYSCQERALFYVKFALNSNFLNCFLIRCFFFNAAIQYLHWKAKIFPKAMNSQTNTGEGLN